MKMNEKTIVRKIYRILWFCTTIITGIMAGFLTSHSIMLGRFFSWLIETGNFHVFTDTFSQFRLATQANVHYNMFLWISLFIGTLWTIFAFILRENRVIALIAGLSTIWVGGVFFASNFSEAEEAVATGVADEATRQFFLSWNLPMHTSFAVFYIICLFLLLLAGTRKIDKK
jgi:hypothetical protein